MGSRRSCFRPPAGDLRLPTLHEAGLQPRAGYSPPSISRFGKCRSSRSGAKAASPSRWKHPGCPSSWLWPGRFRTSPMPASCGKAMARTFPGRTWIDAFGHQRHDSLSEGHPGDSGAHPKRFARRVGDTGNRGLRVGVGNTPVGISSPAAARVGSGTGAHSARTLRFRRRGGRRHHPFGAGEAG